MDCAIVYSRTSSSRLPCKATMELGNSNLLGVVIQNLLQANTFEVVLATSNHESDDKLIEIAQDFGIKYFRGSLENVANRTIECIKAFQISRFARVNGDSPFTRTDLLTQGFDILKNENIDFVTNLHPRTFPYGIAVEVFNTSVFLKHASHFNGNFAEHITSFFYQNIDSFKYRNISSNKKYDEEIMLTVDDPESHKIIKQMFDIDPLIQSKSIDEIVKTYKTISK